jgi:hypothetical protein
VYRNRNHKDFGSYIIGAAACDGRELPVGEESFLLIPRRDLIALSEDVHQIVINLT